MMPKADHIATAALTARSFFILSLSLLAMPAERELYGRMLALPARAFGPVAASLWRAGRKPGARSYDAMIAAIPLANDRRCTRVLRRTSSVSMDCSLSLCLVTTRPLPRSADLWLPRGPGEFAKCQQCPASFKCSATERVRC